MYCGELKSRFRHSRFAFLHELRTYLCSFGEGENMKNFLARVKI